MSSLKARLAVKVTCNAAQDEITGWHDNALKVRVRAKAVKGQANKAVCKLIAKTLALPTSQVRVKSGVSATRKTLWIEGLSEDEVVAALRASNIS